MSEPLESDYDPTVRGTAARIGIVMLNFLAPGLGLFRISHWQLGTTFILIPIFLLLSILALYAIITEMTFVIFVVMISTVITFFVIAFIGSFALTWRLSAHIHASPPWWSRWYALIGVWGVCFAFTLLAPFIRSYYAPYHIVSASMSPNVQISDYVLVKHRNIGIIRRGDLMVVRSLHGHYLTRAVAVPNDTISMVNGSVILNRKPIAQTIKKTTSDPQKSSEQSNGRILIEQFPGEMRPHSILDSGPRQADDWPEIKLGAEEYFFLGDNRGNAADSRFSVDEMGLGIVIKDKIIGRPLFRYWRKGVGYQGSPL